MLFEEPLSFVKAFIDDINDSLKDINPNAKLSMIQKKWLTFCCMAILVTNSVCWAKFERSSLVHYSIAALSWMFRNSRINWNLLLHASLRVILNTYGIKEGVLVIDDSDKKRSKSTKRIFKVHKIKDKSSGGYIMGQSIVFLFLVTPIVSIPLGFAFYMPDPGLTAWYKLNKKLKKQGVPKKKRPKKPKRSDKYPTKQKIALNLLNEFKKYNPIIKIKCVLADALYGTNDFLTNASNIFDGIQVISQLRSNQNIRLRNNTMNLEEYFTKHPGSTQEMKIRGGEKTNVTVGSARFYIVAHGR